MRVRAAPIKMTLHCRAMSDEERAWVTASGQRAIDNGVRATVYGRSHAAAAGDGRRVAAAPSDEEQLT